jgi:ribose/xylose/arabinose/galactoside ABC-type transport system permease subunit
MFLSGLAVWLTASKPVFGLPSTFTVLGSRLLFALPIAAALAGFAHLMLTRSLFGRWLRAVGFEFTADRFLTLGFMDGLLCKRREDHDSPSGTTR